MTACRWSMALMLLMWAWVAPVAAGTGPGSDQTRRLWRLAAQEQATLEQRGIVLHEDALTGYLQTVAARLWKQLNSALKPPVVEVIKDSRMEAYAYPNGHCYLTTGILNQMETEDQLAMIMAHELIHYVRQHAVALYDHFQLRSSATGLPSADQSQTALGNTMAQQIDAAESQADEEGLSILMEAGYCQAQVLPLMSNLTKSVHDQWTSEAVKRLQQRTVFMKTLLARSHGRSCPPSATAADRQFYLSHIGPALLANAQAALQLGDWDLADNSISKLMALNPHNAIALYLKGEVLRGRSDADGQDKSAEYYEMALRIDPNFPSAHRALGELYFKTGRYGMAKPHFESFLSLAPRDDASEYIKGYVRQCQHLITTHP